MYDRRKIYFISTNGGNMGFGQVWMYDLAAETITLVVESSGHDMFDGPDNCCVSPRGGVVFCEDATAAQHVRAVSPAGDVFDIARNLRNSIEFAGACFSPDGDTLLQNLYGRGNERTTQPYRSPVQIPVGPEKYERAATVAIGATGGSRVRCNRRRTWGRAADRRPPPFTERGESAFPQAASHSAATDPAHPSSPV